MKLIPILTKKESALFANVIGKNYSKQILLTIVDLWTNAFKL